MKNWLTEGGVYVPVNWESEIPYRIVRAQTFGQPGGYEAEGFAKDSSCG